MNCRATPKSACLSRLITLCRSSFFLPLTRSWSPWICAWTPRGPSSRIFLLIALALSESMPWMILHSIRFTLPDTFGSPASSAFSEMLRLTSLSLKTSRAARARDSVSAWIVTAFSPAWVICAPVSRKSNLVDSSFAAWWTALSSSCRSTLLTMSNEGSATSLLLYSNGFGVPRYPFAPPGCGTAILTCAVAPRCGGTHEAGCPSGQWERTVNPSRKLRRFESFTRHKRPSRFLTSRNIGQEPPGRLSADFHATGSTQGSDELVAQSPVVPPGHWGGGGEFGFAEDGGVGPSVEADGDGVVGGDDFAGGLEEPALQGVGGDGGVAG